MANKRAKPVKPVKGVRGENRPGCDSTHPCARCQPIRFWAWVWVLSLFVDMLSAPPRVLSDGHRGAATAVGSYSACYRTGASGRT